jgi:hypothetical protein
MESEHIQTADYQVIVNMLGTTPSISYVCFKSVSKMIKKRYENTVRFELYRPRHFRLFYEK